MSRNAQFHLILWALIFGGSQAWADDYLPLPATNAAARIVVAQGEGLLNAFLPDNDRVATCFNTGLTSFTRTGTVAEAWRSLVSTNDVVGIKVFSRPGPLNGTRPAVVTAIVHGLEDAGLPKGNIIIWDKLADDLHASGYNWLGRKLGVKVESAVATGFDTNVFYLPDSPVVGSLVWGDLEFGRKGEDVGKKSFVTKIVSKEITKIISVTPLINETSAGVCGHFFSLGIGSVDNTRRFEVDGDQLATALPEIYALPSVGDRVVLNVTDALLGQYQGGPASYLQYSVPLQQIWFSHDPVALDVMALKELARERKQINVPLEPTNFQIYTNATLLQLGIDDPAHFQAERVP